MANPIISIYLLILTILLFGWVFKEKDKTLMVLLFLLITFFYLYCGFGVGYQQQPNSGYITTYIIYSATLSVSLFFFKKRKIWVPKTDVINKFSYKWAFVIVAAYLFTQLLPLAQSGRLLNLISPPAPELGNIIAETDFEENQVSGLVQSIETFLQIFYIFAIFKYIKKPWIVVALLFLPTYIGYCNSGYIARSGAAYRLMIILAVLYHFYPKTRKYIIISTAVALPTIVMLFAAFVSIRKGAIADNLGFWDSFHFLLETETYYPKWYADIPEGKSYFWNYIYWFITLPLPGVLKPFDINVNFNALFTSDVLGISMTSIQSISLPGLVNEGVFVFGKNLYFIHAIILAYVFMLTYKTLRNRDCNYIALISVMLNICLLTCRGGTSSYSYAIKIVFLVFWVSLIKLSSKAGSESTVAS